MAPSKSTTKEVMAAMKADPVAFRNSIYVETDNDDGDIFGHILDDWQEDDFAALAPAWRCLVGQRVADNGEVESASIKNRAWLERPRGSSKTSDTAIGVLWALWASDRRLSGIAAAADKDQATILRNAIEKIVRRNAWLSTRVKDPIDGRRKPWIDVQSNKVRNTATGSELEIISSDAATSFGVTPDFVVCDELTHWRKTDLWESLLSSAAKRKNCLLLIITNAGYQDSWQWRIREQIREDVNWHFHALESRPSWISERVLAEQAKLLPATAYARLWLNKWANGAGDAIEESAIQSAITLRGPSPREDGWQFVGGLDIGLKRDASALAIVGRHVGHVEHVAPAEKRHSREIEAAIRQGILEEELAEGEYITHPGSGRLRLFELHVWKPDRGRVELEEIERSIVDAHRRFGLSAVAFDPYQAEYLAERLRKAEIPADKIDFTGPNLKAMATAMMEAFGESNIDLWQHADLISDLRGMRIEEKSYGFRLVMARGNAADGGTAHGDTATGLAIALLGLRRCQWQPPPMIDGPLVCWP